jgi:hypothetical protein
VAAGLGKEQSIVEAFAELECFEVVLKREVQLAFADVVLSPAGESEGEEAGIAVLAGDDKRGVIVFAGLTKGAFRLVEFADIVLSVGLHRAEMIGGGEISGMEEPGEGGVVAAAVVEDFADLNAGDAVLEEESIVFRLLVGGKEEAEGFFGGAVDVSDIAESEVFSDGAVAFVVLCGGNGIRAPASQEKKEGKNISIE